MSCCPIIPVSVEYGCVMVWRCFGALREAIVEQCQQAKLVWGNELYFDSGAASTPTLIWIHWLHVLPSKHERPFRSISLPFLSQKSL
jgi:hypothetical protein